MLRARKAPSCTQEAKLTEDEAQSAQAESSSHCKEDVDVLPDAKEDVDLLVHVGVHLDEIANSASLSCLGPRSCLSNAARVLRGLKHGWVTWDRSTGKLVEIRGGFRSRDAAQKIEHFLSCLPDR